MAMRFEHEFTVPVPVEQAWSVLIDVERIAPCLPGAALESVEDGAFAGRMRVKVGPITVTYRGEAAFEDVDKDARTVTLKASAKEARGAGTADAEVTARLSPEADRTRVHVETSFTVTGRPAQFGRGVLADVGARLIDRFAANLAALLEEGLEEDRAQSPAPWPEAAGSVDAEPEGVSRTYRSAEEEALDLLEIAGAPLVRRLTPALGALAAVAVLAYLVRRLLRR
ncbi:SRPBCC family protein [Planotetraspora mira]|uniref:Carbon monoxide dehydrogenase subunit G n=1 Tax=Planotetraspora mira TaxID=58121 RepID=A0A8J3TP96_9ACTN|nr:SRPBCC family protein [Planotetraspora mira]GII29522.1 carbon monoxide dehydrogenase subunit G [Planotetraspora mira]